MAPCTSTSKRVASESFTSRPFDRDDTHDDVAITDCVGSMFQIALVLDAVVVAVNGVARKPDVTWNFSPA